MTDAASLPRVAVGGVLIEPSPRGPSVLLVRRARAPSAGRWTIPGGRVEPNERLADALARELLEETALVVRVGPLVEVVEILEPPHHYVILDYACARVAGEPIAGDDAADVTFAPIAELGSYGVTELVEQVVARAAALPPW